MSAQKLHRNTSKYNDCNVFIQKEKWRGAPLPNYLVLHISPILKIPATHNGEAAAYYNNGPNPQAAVS